MERGKQHQSLNSEFRRSLTLWQENRETPLAAVKMGAAITKTREMGVGVSFRIKREIMDRDESRRAISREDIRRYAKIDGNFFVFNLKAKKGQNGNVRIGVKDLWGNRPGRGIVDRYNFVFEAKSGDGWTTVGVFKPHEIESFIVS